MLLPDGDKLGMTNFERSDKLARFCPQELQETAQPEWQETYAYRGMGSTYDRNVNIEAVYERGFPRLRKLAGDVCLANRRRSTTC